MAAREKEHKRQRELQDIEGENVDSLIARLSEAPGLRGNKRARRVRNQTDSEQTSGRDSPADFLENEDLGARARELLDEMKSAGDVVRLLASNFWMM